MKGYLLGMLVVLAVIVAAQGDSVRYGLLLDDFNHRAQLREGDWTLASLVDAAHLGGHGRRVEMWWQSEADLRFFRPLAFLLMRLEYEAGRWRPEVMHAFSLAWTAAGAALVMAWGRAVLDRITWATLAAVLFVLHPANYLTVRWIACQNDQMATAFVLAGLLCYAKYSGWRLAERALEGTDRPQWLIAALALFAAALGCRETSVLFGVLAAAGDMLVRPGRWRGRGSAYLFLFAMTLAYLGLRHHYLGGFKWPDRPYACAPTQPGFVPFVIDKFVYYMLGLFAYVPIVGFTGMRALRSQPWLSYGGFALLVLLWGSSIWFFRHKRCLWLLIVLALIPLLAVLPVFASSHHLYWSSAGMVIALAATWKWSLEFGSRQGPRARRGLQVGIGALIAAHLAGFGYASAVYGVGVAGFSASSQIAVTDACSTPRAWHAGDRLFFINLPGLAFNCIPGIEEAQGVASLKGYALTFSTGFLKMDRPTLVRRAATNQLCVSLDGEGYFAGTMGQVMLESIGRDRPFAPGETFSTEDFDVEIVRAGRAGIAELLFTFRKPLDHESYHFFLGSTVFDAYPIQFGEPAVVAGAADVEPADAPARIAAH